MAEKKKRVLRLKSFQRELRKPDRIAVIVEVPEAHDPAGVWTAMRFVVTRKDARIYEYVVPLDEDHDIDWWHTEFDKAGIEYYEYARRADKGYTKARKIRRRRR